MRSSTRTPEEVTPPMSTNCKFQVRINTSPYTFQCFTEDEWEVYSAQRHADFEKQRQQTQEFYNAIGGFVLAWWWIFALIIGLIVAKVVKVKYDDWKYDKRYRNF